MMFENNIKLHDKSGIYEEVVAFGLKHLSHGCQNQDFKSQGKGE